MTARGDRIREMLVAGKNYGEIRRELGVAVSTIAYHAKNMGLSGKSKYAQRVDWVAVQACYDAGATIRQTMTSFGMHRSTWFGAIADGTLKLDDTPQRKLLYERSQKTDAVRGRKIPTVDLLCANSSTGGGVIKRRIMQEGLLPYCCSNPRCSLHGNFNLTWAGAPIILHLDHINGVSNDHRLENLRWLCPNCHSQTDTYCGRNRLTTLEITDT